MGLKPRVKTSSWHYRFWSGSYRILWCEPPYRFSICPYFWRVVLFAPLCFYPLGIVARIIALAWWIIRLPFRFVGWLWRQGPGSRRDRRSMRPSFSKRHPTLATTGRVIGDVVGRVLMVLFVLVAVISVVFLTIRDPRFWITVAIIVGLYAIVFGLFFAIRIAFRSDTARLVRDFVKAKKEKVCPFVEVIRS